MKKILFYITYYPGYGGIEKVTTFLSNYLIESYQVYILSFTQRTNDILYQLKKDIHLIYMPDKEFLSTKNINFLREFLDKENFDWIIYQDCYSPIHNLLFQTSIDLKNKLIVCEHNSPCCQLIAYKYYWKSLPLKNFKNILRKCIYPYKIFKIRKQTSYRHQLLLENCNTYILLSSGFKKQIHYLNGYQFDSKIKVFPNPITLFKKKERSIQKKNQIIFVGRLVADKGIYTLMDIWTEFEKKNSNWELHILGDGELKEYIRQTIKKRKLKQVMLEGNRPNIEDYYATSSILIMTSIFEGLPLVLLESMAYGVVPIVFNNFASLTDIIDANINGYSIPTNDKKMFLEKLIYLTENSATLQNMSHAAIQKSLTFDIERIGKLWSNLLS